MAKVTIHETFQSVAGQDVLIEIVLDTDRIRALAHKALYDSRKGRATAADGALVVTVLAGQQAKDTN